MGGKSAENKEKEYKTEMLYSVEEPVEPFAVNVALVEKTLPADAKTRLHVLFEKRAAHLDRQPGEICLPGGGHEGDESIMETAVREICEELLIDKEQVRVLGRMHNIRTGNMLDIAVFLTEISDYKNTWNEEVEEVFSVPLEYFLETDPEEYTASTTYNFPEDFPFDKIPGGNKYKWFTPKYVTYFYEYEGHIIWGLTAKIIKSVAETMREKGWFQDR